MGGSLAVVAIPEMLRRFIICFTFSVNNFLAVVAIPEMLRRLFSGFPSNFQLWLAVVAIPEMLRRSKALLVLLIVHG